MFIKRIIKKTASNVMRFITSLKRDRELLKDNCLIRIINRQIIFIDQRTEYLS